MLVLFQLVACSVGDDSDEGCEPIIPIVTQPTHLELSLEGFRLASDEGRVIPDSNMQFLTETDGIALLINIVPDVLVSDGVSESFGTRSTSLCDNSNIQSYKYEDALESLTINIIPAQSQSNDVIEWMVRPFYQSSGLSRSNELPLPINAFDTLEGFTFDTPQLPLQLYIYGFTTLTPATVEDVQVVVVTRSGLSLQSSTGEMF